LKLNERTLAALPAPDKRNQIIYYDLEGRGNVRGLGLRVTANNARSWTMDYTDAAGKRRRATLARWPDLTLEQARTRASEFHSAMARGEGGPLEAKRAAREQAQAEQMRREHDKTVAQLAQLWMEGHARLHKSPVSQVNDRSILNRHILPRLGSMKVADVTSDDVEALHTALVEKTPTQANRVHALLTTLMRYAIKKKYRADTPCVGLKRYKEKARVVHTTREQLDRLYAALEAHPNRQAINAIKLLVWTGSRRNEVMGASWSEFDLTRGLWNKPAERTKQKRASSIPLNPLALKLLREMHTAKNGELLFPSRADRTRPMRDVRKFWATVCNAAGLETLRVHDLRHVFATTALEAGAPLITIAPLLGHSSTVMTARYAHLSDRMLLEATTKASKLLAAPGEEEGRLLPNA